MFDAGDEARLKVTNGDADLAPAFGVEAASIEGHMHIGIEQTPQCRQQDMFHVVSRRRHTSVGPALECESRNASLLGAFRTSEQRAWNRRLRHERAAPCGACGCDVVGCVDA